MRKTMLIGLTALLAAGCATEYSEVPRPTNYSVLKQKKVQSASHWDVIANDVAEQLKNSIARDELLFVAVPRRNTDFYHAFRNQLISALVNKGVRVSPNGDTRALVIDVEAQLVRFSPNRFQNARFVSSTAIAGGVMAIHGLDIADRSKAGLGVLGITAALDWHQWAEREYANGNTPQFELIVTTSASNGSVFIARRTDVYYITDRDNRLYGAPDSAVNIKITGGA